MTWFLNRILEDNRLGPVLHVLERVGVNKKGVNQKWYSPKTYVTWNFHIPNLVNAFLCYC